MYFALSGLESGNFPTTSSFTLVNDAKARKCPRLSVRLSTSTCLQLPLRAIHSSIQRTMQMCNDSSHQLPALLAGRCSDAGNCLDGRGLHLLGHLPFYRGRLELLAGIDILYLLYVRKVLHSFCAVSVLTSNNVVTSTQHMF